MGFFYIGDEAAVEDADHGEDVAILVGGGELDYAATPVLRQRLAEQLDGGVRHLVLDLSSATFIDSTAIGALVASVMQLREHGGGSLMVVCADENRRVLRILEIAGIDGLMTLHSSREQALAELAVAG